MAGAWALARRSAPLFFRNSIPLLASSSLAQLLPSEPLYKHDSSLLRALSTLNGDVAHPVPSAATAATATELPSYAALRSTEDSNASKEPTPRLSYLLRSFRRSAAVRERALAAAIPDSVFSPASYEFARLVTRSLSPDSATALSALPDPDAHDALLGWFLEFAEERYGPALESYRMLAASLDLRHPHTWFPFARSIQRRIIYHAGPTNSGKTFTALQAMRAAGSGVYCGPLRLLAMEVYEECNTGGTYCNLVTGQERREVPGAEHTACTVEMTDLGRHVDVAVIDEIQMLGDATRGFAWTRALLGVPATEVHVCGDVSAAGLVRWMAEQAGEPFEMRTYERFTALRVDSAGLHGSSYAGVRPGDAVVAFSRQEIYQIKASIEKSTPHRVAVIYGGLPPEVRRRQARLFNDPESGVDVLVASDAVGMGLNLNIGRVVFHSMHKREGGPGRKRVVPVAPSAVKQIAGRAGRRSSAYAEGLATCLDAGSVATLAYALALPLDEGATPKAGLAPEFEQFEAFASLHPPETPFSVLLEEFEREALLGGRFFFCRQEALSAAASLLDGISGLSLRDKHVFATAPASTGDPRVTAALIFWARRYAAGLPCPLTLEPPERAPSAPEEMRALETAHFVAMLWTWLSYRFDEDSFPGREAVEATGERICDLLAQGLENITRETVRLATEGGKRHAGGEGWEKRAKRTTKASLSEEAMFAPFKEDLEEVLKANKRAEKEHRAEEAAERKQQRQERRAEQRRLRRVRRN